MSKSARDPDQAMAAAHDERRYSGAFSGAPAAPAPPADERIEDLVGVLLAAAHALRSYQYGNGAPDLAASTADACDAALARAGRPTTKLGGAR